MTRLDADVTFAIVPEWILDADISANAVRLYAVLRRYADQDGACYPSRATLAGRLRVSRDTVDRAARELVDVGALEVEGRRTASGDRDSNLYRLHTLPGGGRTGAATGGRKDAATVAAPVRHRTRATELEPVEREVPAPAGAGAVAAAFVDEFRAVHGQDPPRQAVARVARDARVMLTAEDRPADQVTAAALEAARSGHPNLPSALTRVLAGGGLSRRERSLRDAVDVVRELTEQGRALEAWQVTP